MEETPAPGLRPLENQWDEVGAAVDNSLQDIKYYIFYYSFMRPSFREYHIDDETEFEVEVIDTWNMTIEKKGILKASSGSTCREENIWLYVYVRSNDHFARELPVSGFPFCVDSAEENV